MNIAAFARYWFRMIRCAAFGGRPYMVWMGCLLVFVAIGGFHYYEHIRDGLVVTRMTDEVSWGIGIASFVFFVGVAAGPVLLVFPAYVRGRPDIREVVLIGLVMDVSAVVMCLLFIMTDLGRPERMWHLFPPLGELNVPSSLLAWDVVVFNGYLLLNLHIPGYLLYRKYRGLAPNPLYYLPFVFVSIFWAVAIHTVTAFLLSGLGSRYFWASAILAPRFLITTGVSAPAIFILLFAVLNRYSALEIKQSVFDYLKAILRITMPVNLFLLGCAFFQEFYSGSMHSHSAQYLYFGLDGHNELTPYIWIAIVFNTVATVIFLVDPLRDRKRIARVGCVIAIIGIWIEKGMGLILPGFVPAPTGEIAEYHPNLGEILVSLGVLALGLFLFSAMTKVVIAIQTGQLSRPITSIPPPAAEPALAGATE
jgi:molybdopterin-containing oxidoreductase family membrane subunit